jgi:hypothetical protein
MDVPTFSMRHSLKMKEIENDIFNFRALGNPGRVDPEPN